MSYVLGQPSFVTLKIFNILGEEVATLIDHELMDDGEQAIEFSADKLPSGMYFYRIEVQNTDEESGIPGMTYRDVKKMLLLK